MNLLILTNFVIFYHSNTDGTFKIVLTSILSFVPYISNISKMSQAGSKKSSDVIQ